MSDQSSITLEEALRRFRQSIAEKPLVKKKTVLKATNLALLEADRDLIQNELANGACPEDLARRISQATNRNYTAESLEKNLRDLKLGAEEKQRMKVKQDADIARQQKVIKAIPVTPDVPLEAEPAGTEVQPIAPLVIKKASDERDAKRDDNNSQDVSNLFGSTPERMS
jgi:hypothetical protein